MLKKLKLQHMPEAYTSRSLPVRAVQIGTGPFIRGFVDAFIHQMNKQERFLGRIIAAPIDLGEERILGGQDGLYTLYLRGIEEEKYTERIEYISCLEIINSTKVSYEAFIKAAGTADFVFTDIPPGKHELAGGYTPLELLSRVLRAMYDKDCERKPVVFPLDYVENNGYMLLEAVTPYVKEQDQDGCFYSWLCDSCLFVNSICIRKVDGLPWRELEVFSRRTCYIDSAVNMAELYHLWIIEDAGEIEKRLPLCEAKVNALFVRDLAPYWQRQRRLTHGLTALAVPSAVLCGFADINSLLRDKLFRSLLTNCAMEEIIPQLELSENELHIYLGELIRRFENPNIRFPVRKSSYRLLDQFKSAIVPTAIEYREKNSKAPPLISFAIASLIYYYRSCEVSDDRISIMRIRNDKTERVLKRSNIWGADIGFMTEVVEESIRVFEEYGVKSALERITRGIYDT